MNIIKGKCAYYVEDECANCCDTDTGERKHCCYHCTKLSCPDRCKTLLKIIQGD